MNKIKFLFVLLFFSQPLFASSQTLIQASAMYARKEYDSAYVVVKKMIDAGTDSVDAYMLAGRALVGMKKYDEAFPYLDRVIKTPLVPAYATAWSLYEMGWCYFAKGDSENARKKFLACYEMNATKNSTKAANNALFKCGLHSHFDNWTTKESAHFIFHIEDTIPMNVESLIRKVEFGYDSLNKFFEAKLPKKIDYFVWADEFNAEKLFGRQLAFTDPTLCLTHTSKGHTLGHEMTHTLSYFAVHTINFNQLISEGTCVNFDLSTRSDLDILKRSSIKSVVEVWKNPYDFGDDIIYPLGGELVGRLIATFGRDKFMQLLTDQTYESAVKIYGPELEKVIAQLERDFKKH